MRRRGLFGLTLAALAVFVVAGAGQGREPQSPAKGNAAAVKSDKPIILVRIEPLEELAADARALAKIADREEMARQIQAMLVARTGPKGVEGVDPKKPIGLYASVNKQLDRSQVVLLLPIADEKTFLDFLGTFSLDPKKGDDGLYTLEAARLPYPLLFRFANGYLYATMRFTSKTTLPAKDKLPLPATVLAGGEGLLSVTANVDQLPPAVRNIAVSYLALTLGNLKEEKGPNETDAQHAVRCALLDSAAEQAKAVLQDGGAFMVRVEHDRKKNDLSLAATFDARKGSPLAGALAALGAQKSVAAALSGKGEAMGGFLSASLPAGVRKLLGPVVDAEVKKGLENHDDAVKDLLGPLAEALKPTMKEGVFDLGVFLRGPHKNGKYTLVGSYRVQGAEALEKAVKKLVEKLPEEARKPFTFDADKAEGVSIHRVEQEKLAEAAGELLGNGPLYFAFRKDALVFTLGEQGLDTLKTSLAVEPKAGKLVQAELSLARIAKLLVAQHRSAPELAKKIFTEKGSDRVRLVLTAGQRLELKLTVKTPALTFAAALDRARKEAEEGGK